MLANNDEFTCKKYLALHFCVETASPALNLKTTNSCSAILADTRQSSSTTTFLTARRRAPPLLEHHRIYSMRHQPSTGKLAPFFQSCLNHLQPSPSDFHGVFKGYHVTLHCLHCLHHLDSRGQQRHPSWLPSSLDPLPSLPAVRPVCLTGFPILGRSGVFAPKKWHQTLRSKFMGKFQQAIFSSVAILAVSVPLTGIGIKQTWVYLVPLFQPIIFQG